NLHLNQSEDISSGVESAYSLLNLNRIYLDAFQQMSTPGGARYPDVNAAINNNMFKGVLAVNYLGHGGHLGWSQERILGIADIQSWTNYNRLPLFVTATCSFTGYDEPTYQSAGEQVLLNPGGGAVALLTTVRPVYASSNKRLTEAVFEQLFEKVNGAYLPLGEVMRIAKNSNQEDTININARKFAIIGDPSMYLALPEHAVVVTEVNGNPIGGAPDTARALDEVRIRGEVRDQAGNKLSAFNGKASITVFDKPVVVRTLANDPKSFEREFRNLSRIIFKGSATVTNGEFVTAFVVPGDIDFSYGNGKVSIYATDGVSVDAGGSYQDLVIGGTSGNAEPDTEGPDIRIFLNNESFVSGDKTGRDPT
ncbi:MAG: C25 family cysteine peptidase, partial [Saprospiraceae bacterium]|nr:C25 family cysteine peptidase [Saprospiraceae bacterium]